MAGSIQVIKRSQLNLVQLELRNLSYKINSLDMQLAGIYLYDKLSLNKVNNNN